MSLNSGEVSMNGCGVANDYIQRHTFTLCSPTFSLKRDTIMTLLAFKPI